MAAGRVARALWGAALIASGLLPAALAQQPELIDREPDIKAAYLYNFGRYVEWPPAAGHKDFIIGVVGETRVATPLTTIAGSKKISNRSITILRIKTEKDFRQCQMLFVPAGQDRKLVAAVIEKARETPTLIVGEERDFALEQGGIGFYVDQNNVKFEINSRSAEKAGLKISSKLLSLGKIVGEKPRK